MKMTSIFKKSWIFAVAIAMVLLMVVAIVPTALADDTAATTTATPELDATSVALSGQVKLNFIFKGIDDLENGEYTAKVYVPVPGKSEKKEITFTENDMISNTTKKDAEGNPIQRYIIQVPLAYGQQADEITVKWFDGETFLGEAASSVKAYTDKVMNAANDKDHASHKSAQTMAKPLTAMLNAGAMAQTLKEHNSDKLANAGLFQDGNPIDGMTSDHFYDMTEQPEAGNTSLIEFKGTEVFLDSKVYLKIYFACHEDSIAQATIALEGHESQVVKVGTDAATGYKYVAVNNISPIRFNDRYTITIKDTNGVDATYQCCVLDWARNSMDANFINPAQKNVAASLYHLYSCFMEYTNPGNYHTGPKPLDPDTKEPIIFVEDAVGKPVETPKCGHTRTYMSTTETETETIYKSVCSDCGATVAEQTVTKPTDPDTPAEDVQGMIRLSATNNLTEALHAGTPKDVTFTFRVAGDVDIQALIFTLKPNSDKLKLTFKDITFPGSNNDNFVGTVGVNVVLDSANALKEAGELVSVTYTVLASEEGNYSIDVAVRKATNSKGDEDIADCFVTSAIAIKADKALCTTHTSAFLKNKNNTHTEYCSECNFTIAENVTCVASASKSVSAGYYVVTSGACECGRDFEGSYTSKYKLGFALDKDDNKTTKAPLFVLSAGEIAAKAENGTRLGAIEMAEDGSYVTLHNKTDATGEGYFSIISKDQGETGRYLAIKYRTTNGSNMEFFAGANNGKTVAKGNENFYLTTGAILVKDGEWHVAIFDLGMLRSSQFKPDDDGKYRADYIRWDIFNNKSTDDQTYDVAYIAMSDDIMSVASFDGNDYYRVGTGLNKESVVVPAYMGSTVTLNPVADAAWIQNASHSGGQTHVLESDSANGGLKYSHITRKGTSDDNYVQFIGISQIDGVEKHYAHTTKNAHVLAVIFRTTTSATHHEGWANSTANAGNGSEDNFTGAKIIGATQADYKWRVAVVNLDSAFQNANGTKTNYYDPALGLTTLRFDYWNINGETDIAEGDLIGDFAFFGVFESTNDAYAYCGEYLSNYGVECMHDATTSWQFISNEGTEYEGTRYAVEAKLCALCGEAVETRSAVVAANFDSIHVDTADGTNAMATWGTSSPTKAGDMSLRVVNLYTATSSSKSGNEGTKYPAPSFLRDNKTINGGGWAGINGLYSGTAYYRVLDKDGNVLLDWTAKGNSRGGTLASTDGIIGAVNGQIGAGTVHKTVSDARRFTMNAIDLSAYASYYQAENSRHANAPIVFEYAFQAEDAPTGSDLITVVKITNIYKNCTSHSMHNVTVEENGKLTVYSECKNCGHVYGSYTMDIGNKAPNYFIGAADLADRVAKDSQVMSKTYTLSDDGSYVTVSNTAGKGDGYFGVFSGNKTVTGRYMVIKYRTDNYTGGWQFYITSNSDKAYAGGTTGDNFYLATVVSSYENANCLRGGVIADGNWHYTVIDLAGVNPQAFKAYDDGSYRPQYLRWDIFDSQYNETKTVDVGYIAFADSIETLTDMDGVVTYQYAYSRWGSMTTATVLPMSTTVGENNPFFDANHLYKKGSDLSSALLEDKAFGNMPYAQFTAADASEQKIDVLRAGTAYNLKGTGKYVGILYRAPEGSANSMEFFISSTRGTSGAVGGTNKAKSITRDNQWRFTYIDISTLKTADGKDYYTDEAGLSQFRLDVLNGGHSAGSTIDVGFIGFFDGIEDMTATLNAYYELYGLYIPTTPLEIESPNTSINANDTFEVTLSGVKGAFTTGSFTVSGIPADATITNVVPGAGVTATVDGATVTVTAIDHTVFDGTIATLTFKTTYQTKGGNYTLTVKGSDLKNGESSIEVWTGLTDSHAMSVVAHKCVGEYTITATQHSINCSVCGTTTNDHQYGNSTVTETAGVVNYVTNCVDCGYKFSEFTSESDRTPNVVVTGAELYNSFKGGYNNSRNQFFDNIQLMQDADGTGFVRFYGSEAGSQAYFYAYKPSAIVETGRYLVYRYRLPANGLSQTQVTLFVSTKNGGMTEGDQGSAPVKERTDGEWYTVIVDLSKYGSTFTADENGKYSAKYVRLDPFGYQGGSENSADYFDLQFVTISDDITDYISGSSKNTTYYNKDIDKSHTFNQVTGYMSWDGSENLGGSYYITEANGLTYNKIIVKSTSEVNLHIFQKSAFGSTTLTPVSDYLAVIYRAPKTVMYNGKRITNKVGYVETFIHSTADSAQSGSSVNGPNYTVDGMWRVAILDLTTIGATYDPATGAASIRLDYLNGTASTLAIGSELQIAAVGFVESSAAGTAWLNSFLEEFYPEGQTEYVAPDVCENHYNLKGWIPAEADGETLREHKTCDACGTVLEAARSVAFRGWLNDIYINGTKHDGTGIRCEHDAELKTYPFAMSLEDKGAVNVINIKGWFGAEGGVKAYYYRVIDENGIKSAWIKVAETADKNTETGIPNDINSAGLGIDSYNEGAVFSTDGLSTGDLAVNYAGQVVTVEYGFCPLNNPGTDAAPNVQAIKQFTNVQVADAAQ